METLNFPIAGGKCELLVLITFNVITFNNPFLATTQLLWCWISEHVNFAPYTTLFAVWISRPNISIHPFLCPLNPTQSRGGAGAYPSSHWARGGVNPGRVASPSQGHTETNSHTHSHSLLKTIWESPINLTCMFFDGGRKPEYPERTHTYTGRTCKIHTGRPQPGVGPGTFWLWGDGPIYISWH